MRDARTLRRKAESRIDPQQPVLGAIFEEAPKECPLSGGGHHHWVRISPYMPEKPFGKPSDFEPWCTMCGVHEPNLPAEKYAARW